MMKMCKVCHQYPRSIDSVLCERCQREYEEFVKKMRERHDRAKSEMAQG